MRKPVDAIQNFKNEIDQAILQIHNDSTKWASIVQELETKIPAEVQSTIRIELQGLASHTIAQAGVDFKCDVDFLAARVISRLKRIKAELLGEKPPKLPPCFCHVVPSVLDLNLSENRRTTITFYGWDFDATDTTDHLVQVALFMDGTNQHIPIPASRIGRTTHYELGLNVAGADFERLLRGKRIVKISCIWDGKPFGASEVLVIQRSPQRKSVSVALGSITHTPRHINGDRDFDTHDDNPMVVQVIGETRVVDNRIECRAYMHARETKPDHTTVGSWSNQIFQFDHPGIFGLLSGMRIIEGPWQVAYTAPTGWRILRVTPLGRSSGGINITDHQEKDINLAQGEVVTRFHIWGDTDGDEAGTYTRTQVFFNDVTVELQEIIDQ